MRGREKSDECFDVDNFAWTDDAWGGLDIEGPIELCIGLGQVSSLPTPGEE